MGLFTLAACQAGPGYPSNLYPGYVYYDFKLNQQPIQNWDANGDKAFVRTYASNQGALVFVEVWCYGVKVKSGYNYEFYESPSASQATIQNVGAPAANVCLFREHVPASWPAPTITVGATHDGSGAVTGIGAVFYNF